MRRSHCFHLTVEESEAEKLKLRVTQLSPVSSAENLLPGFGRGRNCANKDLTG